jgi:glycosyltransferase involved in cell wall biosynthesis
VGTIVGTSPGILLVGPGAGGVADVVSRARAELQGRGWAVEGIVLDGRGRAEAIVGIRAAWRVRRSMRSASAVHIEFGSNDRAVFWFAALACLLRPDCVLVAHDVPKLAHSPGASLIRRSSRRRTIVAHRVLSPVIDPLIRMLVTRRAAHWLVLGDRDVTLWQERVRGAVGRLHLGWEIPPGPALPPSWGRHVLFAGFLGPSKGVDVLLEAWARIARPDDPPLVIAGGSDVPEWVDALKREAGGTCNPPRWLGRLDERRFAALFDEAALVVLPYRDSSAASGILVRALAAGRPVLATRVPALDGLVEDGVQGRVTAPGDATELALALREMLDDPRLRDRYGDSAAATARRELSWDRHVADLEAAYAAVARGR